MQTAFFTDKDSLRLEQLTALVINMKEIFTKENFMVMVPIFMPMETGLLVVFDSAGKMAEVFYTLMMVKLFLVVGEMIN